MKKLILFSFFALYLGSCTYKYTEPTIPPIPPDPDETVSFSGQIIPIWNSTNVCDGCHAPGATSPDLSAANAYNEIMTKNLVDTADAANSEIYKHPGSGLHTHTKYTTTEAALVLLWIEQGAINN